MPSDTTTKDGRKGSSRFIEDTSHNETEGAFSVPLEDIDPETAKYLDPTVIIDEATNRRIKRKVPYPF